MEFDKTAYYTRDVVHSGCSTLGEIILPSRENISPSREKYFTGIVKALASLVLQIEAGKILFTLR